PTLRGGGRGLAVKGSSSQAVPELARVETGFTVAARWQGKVDGEARKVVSLGDVLDVDPPMYEADVGVSIVPLTPVALGKRSGPDGRRPVVASMVGRSYGAPPASAELFAVAKDLGAPGTHVEEACVASRAGSCVRTALEPFYERLDGLLGIGVDGDRGPGE